MRITTNRLSRVLGEGRMGKVKGEIVLLGMILTVLRGFKPREGKVTVKKRSKICKKHYVKR